MLLTHKKFAEFSPNAISDPRDTTEVLNCLSCSSREEVDTLVAAAVANGGNTYSTPQDRGFIANLEAYRQLAEVAASVWREHGALEYIECLADDVPEGEVTSFPMSVQLKEDEVVVFSWIRYESREARDEIMEKVMADPRLDCMKQPDGMPFDGMRLIWGGFKVMLER
ncbi:unnamed protein product [Cyprideis torosa]|uniref:Uncharacterized protein n=1 Tax=Cyprideis torosa TaxID=163714 RepID=A0A7R8ZQ80_9CRUS|nr:unnamed protein product [Cyprideis torosa]CAG0902315.1 unnamed protein product [Cyprideis torosa]